MKLIKEYYLIIFINLILITLFVFSEKTLNLFEIIFLIFFELAFIYALLTDIPKKSQFPKIVERSNGDIIIKGVFTNMKIKEEEIISFKVSMDFFSVIFDLSKITIITPSKKFTIYTKEIKHNPFV